ncbi:MAG: hypothetical protein AB1779_08185, partial [Candidatus Thermoplasmatota archaeon]
IIRGKLTIASLILKINCSFDGQFGIKVEENGKFEVYDSTITSFNPDYKFKFEVHGSMVIESSNINYMWGDDTKGGIQIYSDNVRITNSNIGYSPIGIYVEFASPIISGNIIKNNVYGIYLWHSAPTISDNIIENNTYGIYGTNVPPIIQVISPNGGEIWKGIKTISWSAYDPDNKDVVETVTIKYSVNGIVWNLIVANTENDGAYDWNTALFPDSANYLIKIEGSDGVLVGEDKSDGTFTIDNTQPIITIISPEPRNYQYTDGPILVNYTVFDAIDPLPISKVFLNEKLLTVDYIDVDVLSLGAHVLKVIATDFAGNIGVGTVEFNVTKEDTFLEVMDVYVRYGDTILLTAKLKEDNKPVKNKDIHFYVNDSLAGIVKTDEMGIAKLSYTCLLIPNGFYPIKADFYGDNVFEPSTGKGVLTLNKEKTIIEYIGDIEGEFTDIIKLKAKLTDDEFEPIANKTINFIFGEQKEKAITNENGIAEVPIRLIQIPGIYNLTAEFLGDEYYIRAVDVKIFTIHKKETRLKYIGDTHGQYSDQIILKAELVELNSETIVIDVIFGWKLYIPPMNIPTGIAGKEIIFTLGEQSVIGITDEYGIAYANLTLAQKPGNYTVSAYFAGDEYYLPAYDEKYFIIEKEDTVLEYIGVSEAQYSDRAELKAKLKDMDSGEGIANKTITFSFGDRFIIAKTDEYGVARVAILMDQKPGEYLINVEFFEDDYYIGSNDSKPFKILKEDSVLEYIGDVKQQYSDFAELKALLVDEDSKIGIEGKKIIFILGEESSQAITNENGIAIFSIKITQKPGDYNIIAKFEENDYYLASEDSKPFKIEKEDTLIKYIGALEGQYSDKAELKAKLTDLDSGIGIENRKIYFKIGTQSASAITNHEGIANAYITLEQIPGLYKIEAYFIEDEYYLGSQDIKDFEIKKEDTKLVYHGELEGQYSDKVELEARLSDLDSDIGIANRTIKFILGTQIKESITNGNGIATTTIILSQKPALYTMIAEFAGDDYYLGSIDEKSFYLKKENSVLISENVIVTEPYYAELKATLLDTDGMLVENDYEPGIDNRKILFYINESFVGDAITNYEGIASLSINPYYLVWEHTYYNIKAESTGDNYYLPSIGKSILFITAEARMKVIDGELINLKENVSVSKIHSGVRSSLVSKLDNSKMKKEQALVAYYEGNYTLSIDLLTASSNMLGAFINEVEAQDETNPDVPPKKKIPHDLAITWIANASVIQYHINITQVGMIDPYGDGDNDGLAYIDELNVGADANNWDSDGDNIPDGWEIKYSLDPLNPMDSVSDNDNDDLANVNEYKNGTNPIKFDTDDDLIPDGWEVRNKLNPNEGDGRLDSDGLRNRDEYEYGTDPNKKDSDNDGLDDYHEIFIYYTNPLKWDSDDDGINDYDEIIKGTNPNVPNALNGNGRHNSSTNSWFIIGNKFIRNGYAIYLNDSSPTIVNCVITASVEYDIYTLPGSNPIIQNTAYDNTKVLTQAETEIETTWSFDLTVIDKEEKPIQNMIVVITQRDGIEVFSGITDEYGMIPSLVLTEYVESAGLMTFYSPYTVAIGTGELQTKVRVTIDGARALKLYYGGDADLDGLMD